MARINRFAAATALAAAFCMTAAPAMAAPRHGHWGHWRHHDHVDGGDILAGALVLGGIAAVASAASNNHRHDQYRTPPQQQQRYDYRDGAYRGGPSGLDRAADTCVGAVERTIDPVGHVDGVHRGESGWDVDGTLRDGTPFACSIGNDGAVSDIRVNRAYSGAAYDGSDDGVYTEPSPDDQSYDDQSYQDQAPADGQWDDDAYARARAEQDDGAGDY